MEIETSLMTASSDAGDEKRARVLEGAMRVFLAYGFNRTTMDDIARAAALSRPALYLIFRNKADIYREIARGVVAEILVRARSALAGEGILLRRLDEMVRFAFFEIVKDIEDSPHGSELLDIRNTLAGDVFAAWREEMSLMLDKAIADEAAARGVDLAARELSPRALTNVFLDSLEGMKVRFSDPRCHLDSAQTSVRVLVAALRP